MRTIGTNIKFKATIALAMIICISLLFIKNEATPSWMRNSTYGIPSLINKGEVSDLFIGSSMFKQALNPEIFNGVYENDDYFILAYNGNDPVIELFELEYLLDNNVKIHNLYVDMYAYSAFEEASLDDEKLLLEIPLAYKFHLWKILYLKDFISLSEKANTLYNTLITSNIESIITWPFTSPAIENQFYNGGSLSISEGCTSEYLNALEIPSISSQMNSRQEAAIKSIIYLCQNNNINLTFIETPKYYTVSADYKYKSAMTIYTNLLNDNHVSTITSDLYDFDDRNASYFIDTVHLSSLGSQLYSELLINCMNKSI